MTNRFELSIECKKNEWSKDYFGLISIPIAVHVKMKTGNACGFPFINSQEKLKKKKRMHMFYPVIKQVHEHRPSCQLKTEIMYMFICI